MDEGSEPISARFNANVDFCHNPTAMTTETDYVGFLGDLTQAGYHKLGKITQEVDTLVEHLRSAIKSVGKDGKVVHIAHSQGALITALAAKNLTASEMSQVEVICFGGGTAIIRSQYPHFSRIVNYYALNDPLIDIVPTARRALRTGFTFSQNGIGGEQEFVFLTPRMGNPALDHGLVGETYLEALAWEGRRYQYKYQSLATRTLRPLILASELLMAKAVESLDVKMYAFTQRYIIPVIVWFVALFAKMRTLHVLIAKFVVSLLAYINAVFECVSFKVRSLGGKEKFDRVVIRNGELVVAPIFMLEEQHSL